MSLEQLFKAKFGQEALTETIAALSWVPDQLTGQSDLKPAEREELYAEFMRMKQSFVQAAMGALFKVVSLQSVSSRAPIDACITAATKGAAKMDNQAWFMKHLHKTRLSSSIVKSRLDYLINTYCTDQPVLVAHLAEIKQAIDATLRGMRTDWKQKIRKSYRRTLDKWKVPKTAEDFRLQVLECVAHAFGSEKGDGTELDLEPATLEFYKSVAREYMAAQHPNEAVPQFLEAVLDTATGKVDEDGEMSTDDEADGADTGENPTVAASGRRRAPTLNHAEPNRMDVADSSNSMETSSSSSRKRLHAETGIQTTDDGRPPKKSKAGLSSSRSK